MLGGYHRAEKCGEELCFWGKLLRAGFASVLELIVMRLAGLELLLRLVLPASVG